DSKVNVSYPLIDPLVKTQTARLEVWTGPAGAPRAATTIQPGRVPGDSPRVTMVLNKDNSLASKEITLPATVTDGHVYWLQPSIVTRDNKSYWGTAVSLKPIAPAPSSPYQLVPANLTLNLTSPKERTAKIKYTLQRKSTARGDTEILEVMDTDSQ